MASPRLPKSIPPVLKLVCVFLRTTVFVLLGTTLAVMYYVGMNRDIGKPSLNLKAHVRDGDGDGDGDGVPGRVRVYIYDDPVFDNKDLVQCYRDHHGGASPWQDERHDMAQDMGEVWMHRSLLQHEWRVLEPDEADVFFVPLYPVLSYKLLVANGASSCSGRSHDERMTTALEHLDRNSTHFKRFGGADHAVMCAWWSCRKAFYPNHRMLLRRTVVGINEGVVWWASWGCSGRNVTVPYTASSVLTQESMVGGLEAEERGVSFFFVGTARGRPERANLKVVPSLAPDSIIELGQNANFWSENSTTYAHHMIHSRFCFCPRGDTETSRRLFDAIAAGCIPVMTTAEALAVPYLGTGLDYTKFAIVAADGSFSSTAKVTALVQDLSSRSEEEVAALQEGLKHALQSVVYGVTTGPAFADMVPFQLTASNFLQEAAARGGANLWRCSSSEADAKSPLNSAPAPRTSSVFPPPKNDRGQWRLESETIVNKKHSLLFCAPPNAGSLQLRMLAKRMQGLEHWGGYNDSALLFDPVASGLALLDLEDVSTMTKIYRENRSGWIKIGIVRDPVTRILSSYFDLVQNAQRKAAAVEAAETAETATSPPPDHDRRHRHRRLREGHRNWLQDSWRWLRQWGREGYGGKVESAGGVNARQKGQEDGVGGRLKSEQSDPARRLVSEEPAEAEAEAEGEQSAAVVIPTFEEVVDGLMTKMAHASPKFRPVSSLCGMRYSPFDTIIPFESLQETSTKVVKSLPGGIWETYGASGWGPDGSQAFMEFDYGRVNGCDPGDEGASASCAPARGGEEQNGVAGKRNQTLEIPRRVRDLYEGGSCEWTKFYPDEAMLRKIEWLYRTDYEQYRWYDIREWKERLRKCLERRG